MFLIVYKKDFVHLEMKDNMYEDYNSISKKYPEHIFAIWIFSSDLNYNIDAENILPPHVPI